MEQENIERFDAIQWINNYSPETRDLVAGEIQSVTQFSLIWNFFEAKVCNNRASAACFVRVAKHLKEKGVLKIGDFYIFLSYFRNRYVDDGKTNDRFRGLRLRNNDKPQLVENVLVGDTNDISDIVAALQIIVYRFRNNLFHGLKWVYDIHGQVDNFNVANQVLAKVTELNR